MTRNGEKRAPADVCEGIPGRIASNRPKVRTSLDTASATRRRAVQRKEKKKGRRDSTALYLHARTDDIWCYDAMMHCVHGNPAGCRPAYASGPLYVGKAVDSIGDQITSSKKKKKWS